MRFTNKNFSRKAAAITVATALTVFGGAGAAIAYWTTTGSGSGTATTGSVSAFNITSDAPTGLVPGDAAKPLNVVVTNPNNTNAYLTSVSASISASWSAQADSAKPACTAADFDLTANVPVGVDETPGAHSVSGFSIALKNLSTNQDNCRGVTVPVGYTSN